MKSDNDPRVTLSHAVNLLKEKHGPRVAAHLLYHQALTLTTKEADAAAESEYKNESRP